jgi:hypothetical protein
MAGSDLKMQGFINFPRQKLADSKKTEKWFKENIDFAEDILASDYDLRASFQNKKTNYNLRANVINVNDFEKFINADNLDLDSLPASFQHIGIENNKINLLLGEYSKRRKEWRAYLSATDQDGITRKENELNTRLKQQLAELIQREALSEEDIQKSMEEFQKYATYEFQDVAEITANKILKKEYIDQNLDFLFLRTFEDLLVAGEQIAYCGVLGGEPVVRRVNPMNLYTFGGNSMYIEDSDIIVEYGYSSIGQVIDDYWDVLEDKDINYLESGMSTGDSSAGLGLNRDISVFEYYGDSPAVSLLAPGVSATRTFAGSFDSYGNVRVLRVCWRTRRKIGKRKYYDQDGEVQYDFVNENYVAKEDMGEEVTWLWVNEWLEGTKIGDDVYTQMRPIPYSGKSLVNKSKGTPPYIGTVHSTNDYKVQSLTDVMKPLAYSYDIAYYKRELEIATYKGNFAAINSSMVPSGWDPKEWMRYVTINKFGWLDPTNEILKGPSQGKSAGAFNQFTAANVQLGDPNAIQMYTNLLVDIENTLGKLAGVSGAREGQIQNREAVGNVEREVAQTSHITEKWFAVDSNFRKRVLGKLLEACKYAYKKNPKKAQYLLDDMGMVMINNFDEFVMSELDIHISDSSNDTMLYNELKTLAQAAIQNGQATISDLIAISQTDSIQGIARKLKDSAARIREEQNQEAEKMRENNLQIQQMQNEEKQANRDYESSEKEKDRAVEYAKIDQKREDTYINASLKDGQGTRDSDRNGIADELDLQRTQVDADFKSGTLDLKKEELVEKKRSNKKNEQLKEKQITASNKKKAESK